MLGNRDSCKKTFKNPLDNIPEMCYNRIDSADRADLDSNRILVRGAVMAETAFAEPFNLIRIMPS